MRPCTGLQSLALVDLPGLSRERQPGSSAALASQLLPLTQLTFLKLEGRGSRVGVAGASASTAGDGAVIGEAIGAMTSLQVLTLHFGGGDGQIQFEEAVLHACAGLEQLTRLELYGIKASLSLATHVLEALPALQLFRAHQRLFDGMNDQQLDEFHKRFSSVAIEVLC